MSRAPHQWRGVIEEYRAWLPVDQAAPVVTLREGGTPLVPSQWLSESTGCEVWLKVEGDNPTGSFKDRGMTVAISVALGEGATAVVCASTGNTSASMSAYAARVGLRPIVLVPEGRIATGKMAQAVVHGASVLQVRGGFDDCLKVARGLADSYPVALVNSVNPMRLQGQKTAACEVVDALGRAPDVHVVPVGNAGNISAYWMGYRDYAPAAGPGAGAAESSAQPRAGGVGSSGRPRMWGVQAAGAAPLVRGEAVAEPDTVASAIRIGNPASWRLAEQAREESGGRIDAVSDAEILAAQRELATREGVFVEPASAAGIAGLLAAQRSGRIDPGQVIAVTVTGHGLKDVDTALSGENSIAGAVIDADVVAAAQAAGLE